MRLRDLQHMLDVATPRLTLQPIPMADHSGKQTGLFSDNAFDLPAAGVARRGSRSD